MWIEQQPKEGDTVKIEFADWTNLGIKIGVCKKFNGNKVGVFFGDCMRFLDANSTFFVYKHN